MGLGQTVDSLGRPATAVYGGTITIEMNTPANDPTLYEWMVNPEKRMDGQVILRRLDSRAVLKSIKFYSRDVGPNLWPDETPMGYIPDETAPKEEENPKRKKNPVP